MTITNPNPLLDKVETFYEQYLYLKDIQNVYLDIDSAFEESDKAKTFFSVAACACIDSYEMTVARLFDSHKNAETIRTLIVECRNNIIEFSDQNAVIAALNKYEQNLQINPYKNLLDVIRHRRNKYIAHNDPIYFPHKNLTDPAVLDNNRYNLYELWLLIRDTGSLLELLWNNLTTDTIELTCQYNRDLPELFPERDLTVLTPIG